MAGNLRADSAVMKTAASNVNAIVADMKSTISSLSNEVQQAASYWKGSAQTKYQAAMAEWNNVAEKLKSALDAMSDNLNTNANQYAAAEDANAGQFNINL